MHLSIEKGEVLVFCSDGLGSSLQDQGIGNTIVSLVGADMLDAELANFSIPNPIAATTAVPLLLMEPQNTGKGG